MDERGGACKTLNIWTLILVGKSEGKRPFED